MTRVTSNHALMLCGIAGGKIFNDAHVFDISSQRWMAPVITGTPPTPRWGHSATLLRARDGCFETDSLILLGGREGSKPMPFSELYTLDLTTFEWTKRDIPGPWPRNRYGHSALFVPDSSQVRCGMGIVGCLSAVGCRLSVVGLLSLFWLFCWCSSLCWSLSDCNFRGPRRTDAILPRHPHVGYSHAEVVDAECTRPRAFQTQRTCDGLHSLSVRDVIVSFVCGVECV